MPVLYIRVEQPLKDALEQQAREQGRSLNKEVSIRLRKSVLMHNRDPRRSTRGREFEFMLGLEDRL